MLIATLRTMSPRGRTVLLRWTAFGTLGCIFFAQTANWLLFRDLGSPALGRALFSGTIIPLALAMPLFFYLTLKMRELAIANHKLRDLASTDSLTRFLTRGAFTRQVDALLGSQGESGGNGTGAMLVIDADLFKRINDRFGHGQGDEALRLIAASIRSVLRPRDLAGRMGGEEFGVFLPGPVDPEAVAEAVRKAVESARFTPKGRPWPLTVSIGGVSFAGTVPFGELYREADGYLYEAKRRGRNRAIIARYEPAADGECSAAAS